MLKQLINNFFKKFKKKRKPKQEEFYKITRYEDVYDKTGKKVSEATINYICDKKGNLVVNQGITGNNNILIGMIIDNRSQ